MDNHSYVFKLKYIRLAPDGQGVTKEETRRYGFTGDLRQKQVYAGLYDRTAQVFNLAPDSFTLTFPTSAATPPVGLTSYELFLEKVCASVLEGGNLDSVKRDEKGRIVLIFGVVEKVKEAAPAKREPLVIPPMLGCQMPINPAYANAAPVVPEVKNTNSSWERDIEIGSSAPATATGNTSSTESVPTPLSATPLPLPLPVTAQQKIPVAHPPRFGRLPHHHPHHHTFQGPRPPLPIPVPYSTLFTPAPPTLPTPPPPPQTNLSSLAHPNSPLNANDRMSSSEELARKKREVTLNSFRGTGASGHGERVKARMELMKKCAEERKKMALAAAKAKMEGGEAERKGYTPSYISPPSIGGVATVFERALNPSAAANVAPLPPPLPAQAQAQTQEAPWKGVQKFVKKFVDDFNQHVSENFGEEMGKSRLELSICEGDEKVKKEEVVEAEATKEEEEEKVDRDVVHSTCWCDRCLKTIRGPRHKCSQCFNFDLCETCLEENEVAGFHDKCHAFKIIRKPGDRPEEMGMRRRATKKVAKVVKKEEEKVELQEHPATCDICEMTIRGVRHKCINCPDYDVCTACLPRVSSLHPLHNFLPITNPVTLRAQPHDRQIHHSVICDGCSASPIVGIRYRCTHPDCQDPMSGGFDLCANCEADPIPRHDRGHVMLKIRDAPTFGSIGSDGFISFGKKMEEVVRQARRFNRSSSGSDGEEKEKRERRDSSPSPTVQIGNGIANLLASLGVGNLPSTSPLPTPPPTATRTTSTATSPVAMLDQSVNTTLPSSVTYIEGKGDEKGQDVLVVDVDVSGLSMEEKRNLPQTVYVPIKREQVVEKKDKEAFNEPYDVDTLVREAEMEKETEEQVVPKEFEVEEKHETVDAEVPAIPTPPTGLPLDAEFVSDVTLKDGTLVPAGGLFVKIWQVKNTGTSAWPVGTKLVNIGGFSKSPVRQKAPVIEVALADVGECVELNCELKAPEEDGRHMDHWRLSAPDGELFGDRLWVDITVESDSDALRNSGSSLSSSIIAPSVSTPGGNFQSAPSVSTTEQTDSHVENALSDFESVRAESEDSAETSDEDEEEDEEEEDEDDDSEGEFIVLSGSEDVDSDSDEDWTSTA